MAALFCFYKRFLNFKETKQNERKRTKFSK